MFPLQPLFHVLLIYEGELEVFILTRLLAGTNLLDIAGVL